MGTEGGNPTDQMPIDLGIFQLGVPVEIVPPALRSIPESDGDSNRRNRFRSSRYSAKMHPRFRRRSSTFAAIACDAAGDDILPILSTALRNRQHVIEGQLA